VNLGAQTRVGLTTTKEGAMAKPVRIRLWPKLGGDPDDLGVKELDAVPGLGRFEFEHEGVLIHARATHVEQAPDKDGELAVAVVDAVEA
jgi:hypothetical protein